MRNLIIASSLLILVLQSCQPTMQPEAKPVPSLSAVVDTLNSSMNDSVQQDLTTAPILIKIYDNQVIVESNNVNTTYNVEADKVFINRSETGLIEYIQINEAILFREASFKVNHVYQYLDNNCIIASKGNTIDGIIADHPELRLTKSDLIRCNPFLTRGLQIGDRIKLVCY